ncbi:probable isoprenylcysteine alpha-carbonyl methylesterase ICMEL1 isoform X3 [Manihot esculenta]|uniref:probable isoprenylcysteine alpha-carbonyl methylesterase ICMEL1 isoform X3 n=1 Tax=Manihot esculenta TaxID=3983 RepID=UPI000B5D79C3|nr:probable isoprenylcysteine alpha-carbonyl methylesterase ICMEL1 isoform X3 [Manihot esculenta]
MPSPILPVTIKQSPKHSFLDPTPPISSPTSINPAMLLKQEIIDDPETRILISSPFDEETAISTKPLLSRSSSFVGSPRQSVSREMGHAAVETFLLTRLSLKLLTYLGVGYKWIMRFLALGCYSLMLLPGFIQVGCYYFFSRQVLRSIVYGDQPRNRLDLYLPKNTDGPKPVVAFVTGGAWIIGYKAWGSLLGKQLSERDIIVACIDYRNFPQGTMSDMVKDASQGISFVCNNIAQYGGDPNRIYLMGQSAGAHIAACALVEQAIKEASEGESVTWRASQIMTYFGLSGGVFPLTFANRYNLLNLVDYFHSRGLYRSIFLGIMEGEESLERFSPEVIVQDPNLKNAVSLLPPIVLFHGTADYSIPCDASKNFAETLQRVGVRAESILYEGKTHTDVFLQDPMRGGNDQMFEDLVAIVHSGDPEAQAKDAVAPPRRRLVPELMLQVARRVSPF